MIENCSARLFSRFLIFFFSGRFWLWLATSVSLSLPPWGSCLKLAIWEQPLQQQSPEQESSLPIHQTWDGTREIHNNDHFLPTPLFSIRFVQSWIDSRQVQSEKANLTILFDRYIPICLETLRVRFKKVTPVTETSMIQTLCFLLEALLTPANIPYDTAKEIYELYFVFAAVWAFGGAMFQDQVSSSQKIPM